MQPYLDNKELVTERKATDTVYKKWKFEFNKTYFVLVFPDIGH